MCKRLCLSWSSTGSTTVLLRTTVFCSMFQRLTPRMSLKHLIWQVFNFRVSCCVIAQVSAQYRRADITNVRNARILVAMLMFLLRNSFLLHICYTRPALSSLTAISFCTFPD